MSQSAIGSFHSELTVSAEALVPLYGIYELSVTNDSSGYTNPFDFDEIELEATFHHEDSGHQVDFFGFYDGDGQGGQAGDIWKLRFMPDRTGTWTYTYSWSDGTPGGSGTFEVEDSGLPGPIRPASGNSTIFQEQGGGNLIPYYVTVGRPYNLVNDPRTDPFFDYLEGTMGAKGIAAILVNRVWLDCQEDETCSPSSAAFSLANWYKIDQMMAELTERNLGLNLMFYSDDAAKPQFEGQSELERLLLKYTIARLGAHASLTFDSGIDILEYRDAAWSSWFAEELTSLDPWSHLVGSRAGGGSGNFSCSNCTLESRGDVHPSYGEILAVMEDTTKPVLFTDRWREDYRRGNFDSDSIRRISWHAAIAGGAGFVIGGRNGDLGLSDFDQDIDAPEQLNAFSEFWHSAVDRWDTFSVCNSELNAPACFGEQDQEYVIYLEASNPITLDLSATSNKYSVDWLNPRNGDFSSAPAISGGGPVTISPPADDGGDWVLHLKKTTATPIPGDLNADGVVDVLHVQLCANVVLGTELDEEVIGRADVNGDGVVNVLDVQTVVNLYLGR